MALIPQDFFKAVVAIGKFVDNKIAWIGTGFLYGHTVDPAAASPQALIYMVTNRHVLKGLDTVILRFENSSGTSNEFSIALKDNNGLIWRGHADQDIDVAVVQINGRVLQALIGQVNFFGDATLTLPMNHADFAHVFEGDGVFQLGFPLGLVDSVQNLPIARGGTIARIKDCKASRSKFYLIDCQTFPGNSGGPVVLRPEIVSITGTTAISKAYLIGIVAAYLPYQDVAVSTQTGRNKIVFEENSGLSIVFPVDCIRDTIAATLTGGAQVAAQPQRIPDTVTDTNEVQAPPSVLATHPRVN